MLPAERLRKRLRPVVTAPPPQTGQDPHTQQSHHHQQGCGCADLKTSKFGKDLAPDETQDSSDSLVQVLEL